MFSLIPIIHVFDSHRLAKGDVYVWGFGQHGALSVMAQFENSSKPIHLPAPRFKKVPGEEKLNQELGMPG
jgi:hypothetical protein